MFITTMISTLYTRTTRSEATKTAPAFAKWKPHRHSTCFGKRDISATQAGERVNYAGTFSESRQARRAIGTLGT
jgi:hypothetical protein